MNPNLGASATLAGRYTEIGKTVIGDAVITPSGAGFAAGTGQYFFVLPVAPRTTENMWIGHVLFFDASTANSYVGYLALGAGGSGNQVGIWLAAFSSGSFTDGYMTNAAPVALATSDQFKFQFCYEAA